jgi:hypothetical protein
VELEFTFEVISINGTYMRFLELKKGGTHCRVVLMHGGKSLVATIAVLESTLL